MSDLTDPQCDSCGWFHGVCACEPMGLEMVKPPAPLKNNRTYVAVIHVSEDGDTASTWWHYPYGTQVVPIEGKPLVEGEAN